MAKKSAKSKGFRKQNTKKPYLSKKDILWLCVVLAVLAVGAFFLFRYDDGALKVQDGAVVTEGDNWLIVDGSNVRGRSRYFKLGEIGDIDGYAREKEASMADANVPLYSFTADAEGGIDYLSATCSHNPGEALAKYTMTQLEGIDSTTLGELQSAELAGQTVHYYICDTAPTQEETAEEAPEEAAEAAEEAAEATEEAAEAAEEAAEATEEATGAVEEAADGAAEATEEAAEAADSRPFARTISGYIDATHDSCVVLRAEGRGETAEACPSDEALVASLEQIIAAITLEEGK